MAPKLYLTSILKEEIAQGKTAALIAHLTLVGCLIAITMNLDSKNVFARFYIRQTFGLHICFHASAIILNYTNVPYAWVGLYLLFIGLWAYSFLGVLKNKGNLIPLIGSYFQKWFTFIS